MNQTTNYGFNVPVGSDVVNPLVQDFPNWSALDTILKNIANTGITTATHTKSGTIHTLSFTDTTVPMIRFQATADFNTNDTFTVNGLSVSALTVAGESLPDGAFVIGSMVLCELRDNLLTVYTSATDATTLEGHPASYFATATDLQLVDGKADANKVLIDNLEDDVSDILTTLGNVGFKKINHHTSSQSLTIQCQQPGLDSASYTNLFLFKSNTTRQVFGAILVNVQTGNTTAIATDIVNNMAAYGSSNYNLSGTSITFNCPYGFIVDHYCLL